MPYLNETAIATSDRGVSASPEVARRRVASRDFPDRIDEGARKGRSLSIKPPNACRQAPSAIRTAARESMGAAARGADVRAHAGAAMAMELRKARNLM